MQRKNKTHPPSTIILASCVTLPATLFNLHAKRPPSCLPSTLVTVSVPSLEMWYFVEVITRQPCFDLFFFIFIGCRSLLIPALACFASGLISALSLNQVTSGFGTPWPLQWSSRSWPSEMKTTSFQGLANLGTAEMLALYVCLGNSFH